MNERKRRRARNSREMHKAGAGARVTLVKAARESLKLIQCEEVPHVDHIGRVERSLVDALRPFKKVEDDAVLCVTDPAEFRMTNAAAMVWWREYASLNGPGVKVDLRLTCRPGHGACSTSSHGLCSDLILEAHPTMEAR